MIVYLGPSVVIAIIGLFLFYASSNPKHARIGELCFFAGLFTFLLRAGSAIGVMR